MGRRYPHVRGANPCWLYEVLTGIQDLEERRTHRTWLIHPDDSSLCLTCFMLSMFFPKPLPYTRVQIPMPHNAIVLIAFAIRSSGREIDPINCPSGLLVTCVIEVSYSAPQARHANRRTMSTTGSFFSSHACHGGNGTRCFREPLRQRRVEIALGRVGHLRGFSAQAKHDQNHYLFGAVCHRHLDFLHSPGLEARCALVAGYVLLGTCGLGRFSLLSRL
jgi:hypothetical protein